MADQETIKRLGRYEIVRELGRGAMGVVYEGFDPAINRRVAIKTARRDVIESSTRADELMARFLREARAAGALNHPNIVTIYDAGEEDGVAFIAMEFLDGTNLQDIIDKQKRFDTARVLEVAATVAEALHHAHEHGIVHRDIKPSNIVMLANGTIKVADFGIARVTDSRLTQEGSVIGTPHYMSPEQFMGHPVDGRSDQFSVGIILYEMLTGEKPFHGRSLNAVMHNVLHTHPVPPRDLNFGVADCLSRVIMKTLSKDPRDRYATAGDLCKALRECMKENPDLGVLGIDAPAPAFNGGATIPTGAGAAVASEATATVVRETPPAHDPLAATVPTAAAPTSATAEGGAGTGAPAVKPYAWKIGSAVAAALLLLAGGVWTLWPEKSPAGNGGLAVGNGLAIEFLEQGDALPSEFAKAIPLEILGAESAKAVALASLDSDAPQPVRLAATVAIGRELKDQRVVPDFTGEINRAGRIVIRDWPEDVSGLYFEVSAPSYQPLAPRQIPRPIQPNETTGTEKVILYKR